jgi:hypothetical protein
MCLTEGNRNVIQPGQSLHAAAVAMQPLAVPVMDESRDQTFYVVTSSVGCVQPQLLTPDLSDDVLYPWELE